jgi:branched-subunit amino acid aminotransferase/4-amino-4-deoxychorismate lyase
VTILMLNGELVPSERAVVPALDRGLTHGLGLYETIKLVSGYPVFFEEHTTRLDKGLAQLGLHMPGQRSDLARQIVRLSEASEVPDGACRVLVTGGPPDAGPTVLMQMEVRAFPAHPLALISYRALRSTADLKSKTFTTSWLAQQAAQAAGADDALFVDEEGRAHEATTANLFLFIRGELRTPPVDGSILPGVVRAQLMGLAAAAGMPVRKAHICVEELAPCDTLMLTSSVRGIAVAASIDGAALDTRAPIAAELRHLLQKAEAHSAAAFRTAYDL